MANLKISELTPLGVAPDANDIIPLTDVNLGVTRSVKISELQAAVQALASNLTDISPIVQANGTMIASNGTNFVSLNTLLPTGLTQIRSDLGLGSVATTQAASYATSTQGATADTAQQPPSEGAFVDGDKTKLDGVETSADVTDTANVTAAGALMDSEVTNLAEVKAFDSTDYATAAQGTLAASATQPADNISTLTNDSAFIASAGAPVQSVAGRTGTVTLSNTDVSGLGTAALLNSGPSDGNVVVLDATGLPAVDGSQLTGISFAFKDITTKTASFSLSASESGKVINCNSGSRIDITIPAGLTAGFNCRVVQKGLGRVRFLTDGTTTLNSYHSTGSEPNAVIGRYGVVDLVNTATNAYHLDGNYEYLFVYSNAWSNAFDGGASQEFRTTALSRPSGTWSNNIPYTLSAWIKPNATTGDGGVIGLLPTVASSTGSNGNYVGSFYHSTGTKYAWYQGNENQGGGVFTVGSWNHLVQIWDGSNLKGYIDGVLVVSVSKADNGLGTGGTIAIHGSSRARWNDRAPIGIDEVAMWDTALTDGGVSVGATATGQIATLYNSGTPSDLTSLSPIGWWLMGDSQTGQSNGGTTPTTITDVGIGSHTKADGTLFGSATYSNLTP
mgnify:CR=1 FL=1|tara:strand:- start:5466 stop:7316 length:1851 start_codon:yes stop_codon:yes gene_type:complete